jgi:hypothetical protein
MKMIYVASPYAGDVERNTEYAKLACRTVMEQGHAFFAPHLLYPAILDDSNPRERRLGMSMGLAMLSRCDELWAFGERISAGMSAELAEAKRLDIPVRRIIEQTQEVKKAMRYGVMAKTRPGSMWGVTESWCKDENGETISFDTKKEAQEVADEYNSRLGQVNVFHQYFAVPIEVEMAVTEVSRFGMRME